MVGQCGTLRICECSSRTCTSRWATLKSEMDEADPLDEGALAAALKCVSDWRVVVAARRANITTGVVPTDTMVQQVEELRQQMPESMGPPPLG